MPLSVWTAQPAMVRYSLTYPVTTPFTTRYAPGLQNQGGRGGGPLHISFFKLNLVSSEKRARLVTLWSNLPFLFWQTQLHPPKNEHYPPVLGAENHMWCTCMLTWTHMSQALVLQALTLREWEFLKRYFESLCFSICCDLRAWEKSTRKAWEDMRSYGNR